MEKNSLPIEITCKKTEFDAEKIAEYIERFTHGEYGEVQMLPISKDDVFKKDFYYIALADNQFAGFIAASQIGETDHFEVGTLLTKPAYRAQGIATKLIEQMTSTLKDQKLQPIAFVNKDSKPLFTRAGYQTVPACEIPQECFKACSDCPKKPVTGCCDKQVKFIGENNEPINI